MLLEYSSNNFQTFLKTNHNRPNGIRPTQFNSFTILSQAMSNLLQNENIEFYPPPPHQQFLHQMQIYQLHRALQQHQQAQYMYEAAAHAIAAASAPPFPMYIDANILSPYRLYQQPAMNTDEMYYNHSPIDNSIVDDQHQNKSSTYKTEMCHSFLATNQCVYHDLCHFAHSVHELRSREVDIKYKTELCKNFTSNTSCCYSTRCKYIHDDYRVQVRENEFWLVSPSDNLIRIENVPVGNQARIEQLTELVNSEHNQRMIQTHAHLSIYSNATTISNIHVIHNLHDDAHHALYVPAVKTQASDTTNLTVVAITPIIPLSSLIGEAY
jgi:hypothetical protein